MTEEDEAFEDIERKKKSLNRKRQICTNPYRNQIIDEVAEHVLKLQSFGQDTVYGLAIYIKTLKE
jgi:hypothetical protein